MIAGIFFKAKKYPFYRLDTFISKNKYMNVKIVDEGGWHFSQLKTPKEIEIKLLNLAIKNKIPILAVCRGFQLVAKFFKSKISKTINHVRSSHVLKINNKNHRLKIKVLKVNSYHNYAVNQLPRFFDLIIRCSDNSIEIAKSSKYKILSFMFHPERKNISQKQINKIVFSHFKIK